MELLAAGEGEIAIEAVDALLRGEGDLDLPPGHFTSVHEEHWNWYDRPGMTLRNADSPAYAESKPGAAAFAGEGSASRVPAIRAIAIDTLATQEA